MNVFNLTFTNISIKNYNLLVSTLSLTTRRSFLVFLQWRPARVHKPSHMPLFEDFKYIEEQRIII